MLRYRAVYGLDLFNERISPSAGNCERSLSHVSRENERDETGALEREQLSAASSAGIINSPRVQFCVSSWKIDK